MESNDREKSIYNELKQLVDAAEKTELYSSLRDLLKDVDLHDRRNYEKALLQLALKEDIIETRTPLYDVLSSLASLWNAHSPNTGLIKQFDAAYEAGKNEEAAAIYSSLKTQGLDFIGRVKLEPGKLIPIDSGEKSLILTFHQQDLHLLDLHLEKIATIAIPGGRQIIDILPPLDNTRDPENDVNRKLWILLEDDSDRRTITSMNIEDKCLDPEEISVDEILRHAGRLSRFSNHLLLVTKDSIYYFEKVQGWIQWFRGEKEGNDITCTAASRDRYWIGLSDGNVRILKHLDRVGVREKFAKHPDRVKNIIPAYFFVAVVSDTCLTVSSSEVTPLLKLEKIKSKVVNAAIFNDHYIALMHASGMLSGWNIKNQDKGWQINLKEAYSSIFTCGSRVFCAREGKDAAILEIPDLDRMVKRLENRGIFPVDRSLEKNPTAPVQYPTEFVGRERLLESIKSDFHHYLVTGGPKVGKTSLLKVLDEILINNSNCCYVDVSPLLEHRASFDHFEDSFIGDCLSQHGLREQDLEFKTKFNRVRAAIRAISGSKPFCVFCLDNFSFPSGKDVKDKEWPGKFQTFLTDLFMTPNSRLVISASQKNRDEIEKKFRDIEQNTIGNTRSMISIPLPIFDEREARDAIRKTMDLNPFQVEDIFRYCGNFPHLLALYKNWKKSGKRIVEYSQELAKRECEFIYDFFREIGPDARLFLATLFYKDLISREIVFNHFYHDIPLFGQLIPKSSLKKTVMAEINDCCAGFSAFVNKEGGSFSINTQSPALLFREASHHLPWLKVFMAMNEFSSNPAIEIAQKFIGYYSSAAKISLFPNIPVEPEINEYYDNLDKEYRDDFFVRRISEEGRNALGLPLETFIVIPLKRWVKFQSIRIIHSLYTSIEEMLRKYRIRITGGFASQKFYILLFEFHGTPMMDLKDQMKELQRISVIDNPTMKNIILDANPSQRTSEEIFKQLNISERSPYITSGAVRELFFGRDIEIALIRGLPENIGIFGTRTIGKTSLLLKLYGDIKAQPNWRVYFLDCSGIEDEEDLLRYLASKMEVSLEEISTLEKFIGFVALRAHQENTRFLFLLDEVDGLVAYDINNKERIFQAFNKLCNEPLKQGQPAARFILCGFEQMYEQMKNPRSRLYNFMVFLPLGALDPESAFSLVTRPMSDIHVTWENLTDAHYLVENCSCYPLFLQAACHTLLSILDNKKEKNDIIERDDVESIFTREKFIDLCMRFYDPHIKKSRKAGGLFGDRKIRWKEEPFFEHIHQMAILALITGLWNENKKEPFTLPGIQAELNQWGVALSPGLTRKIVSRLCLNGTLRLLEAAKIISPQADKIPVKINRTLADQDIMLPELKNEDIMGTPDMFDHGSNTFLGFSYCFGIKNFPKILISSLGGIESCKKELLSLVKEGEWKNWIRRNS